MVFTVVFSFQKNASLSMIPVQNPLAFATDALLLLFWVVFAKKTVRNALNTLYETIETSISEQEADKNTGSLQLCTTNQFCKNEKPTSHKLKESVFTAELDGELRSRLCLFCKVNEHREERLR